MRKNMTNKKRDSEYENEERSKTSKKSTRNDEPANRNKDCANNVRDRGRTRRESERTKPKRIQVTKQKRDDWQDQKQERPMAEKKAIDNEQ